MLNQEALKRCARTVAYLVEAWERKQLSLAKVAIRLAISQQMLIRYENGSAIPTLPFFFKWCDALGIEPKNAIDIPPNQIPLIATRGRMILELYQASVLGEKEKEAKEQMTLF